jgi:tetratricopeptide (TPR) repeat protein
VRCFPAALVCLAVPLACVTTPLHDRDWFEVRTPHFEIVSSLSEDETLELARDVERFTSAVEFVMGTRLPAPVVPTRIYAFDGRGFTRPFNVRGAPGYFLPSLREGVIVLRTGDGWRLDATENLRHEYVHYLLRNQGGFGLPLWFDEGAAEFLSTLEVKGDRVELGRFREDHVRLLRDQPWVPLIRILQATSLEEWGKRKRRVFQAESWAFVHYLNFGLEEPGRGQAQLGRYLRSIADGAGHEQAIREAFGVGSSDLDRELQRFVRSDRFHSVAVRIGNPEAAEAPQMKPLAQEDVVTRLGWLSISLGRAKQAQRYFEMAVAADPRNASAHAGLGAAEGLRGRWDAANPHYGRALGIAPDDALVQADVGGYYDRKARETGDAETRARLAALARRHYARSWELDDSLPEPYARYGATFLLEGQEAERGLEPLERANRMLPSSAEIKLLLARLHARLGRPRQARIQALAVFSRTHSAATRNAAQALMAEIDDSLATSQPQPSARSGDAGQETRQ